MSKIFDCFLYNGEKDIVSLRFEIMGPFVEKFVIIESSKTFSGLDKPFYFESDRILWGKWEEKIQYVKIEEVDLTAGAWSVEHFLRNELKHVVPASGDDLIIIADADEIVNLDRVRTYFPIEKPTIIPLPTYYNFYNNKSTEVIKVTLISPYREVKGIHLGDRNLYKNFCTTLELNNLSSYGGHFTYMFGYNVDMYIQKIQSFSHQEFNNNYFLGRKRIENCVKFGFDLFDRREYSYQVVNLKKDLPWFAAAIKKLGGYDHLLKPTGLVAWRNQVLMYADPFFIKARLVFWQKRFSDLIYRIKNG